MSSILADMFADASTPADLAAKLETYKEKMAASIAEVDNGQTAWGYGHEIATRTLRKGISANPAKAAGVLADLEKSLTADQVQALGGDLAQIRQYLQADITKDWTPTNPVGGTGLVPYDLEAPLN